MAACFTLSVAFHTLMAHSQALYMRGMQLDFQGVLLLMWGATVPLVYYTFPCKGGGGGWWWWWSLRGFYVGLFTLLVAACSAVTFMPRFSGPQLGPYRAALFGLFGVGSFALPIGHGVVMEGVGEMWERVGLGWILVTVVCNGVGVVLYAMKVSTTVAYFLATFCYLLLTSCALVPREVVSWTFRYLRCESPANAHLRRCGGTYVHLCASAGV